MVSHKQLELTDHPVSVIVFSSRPINTAREVSIRAIPIPAQQATSNATPMCALRVSAFRPNRPRDGQHGRHYLIQYHLWYECYI